MWLPVITQLVINKNRIGLYGGTFDPVHLGHLRTAVEVTEAYSLDALHLLPNHQPVHRGPADASTDHRLSMLKLAVAEVDELILDTREATRDGPSYTIDTLTAIHDELPDAQLLFVMGMDAFAKFDTWKNWRGILKLATLVVLDRPGAEHSEFSRRLLAERADSGGIDICNVTQLAISATNIRYRVANGLSLRFMVPETVREYIDRHNLYQ